MEETHTPAEGQAPSFEERLGPQWEKAKERLSELDKRASGFIREHPIGCLVGALALGYVIGRIASRNS